MEINGRSPEAFIIEEQVEISKKILESSEKTRHITKIILKISIATLILSIIALVVTLRL